MHLTEQLDCPVRHIIFDCIVNQIDEDVHEAFFIDPDMRRLCLKGYRQPEPFRLAVHPSANIAQPFGYFQQFCLRFKIIFLQRSQLQYFVHHLIEPLCLLGNVGLGLKQQLGVIVIHIEQVHISLDRGQRRLELMADIADILLLLLLQRLKLGYGELQLALLLILGGNA
ncbi:hypothetical protein D3C80_1485560 [compost metagenome]